MTRGRAAALPEAGHRRPDVLQDLVVVHVNEKGDRTTRYDFSTLPVPEVLQRELAAVFADRVRPTGPWRNLPTSRQGWQMLGQFARWLADQDHVTRSLAEVDRAVWLRWTLSRPSSPGGRRAVRVVALLLRDQPAVPAGARREMARRHPDAKADEPSYSDDELKQISGHARAVFGPAERRIATNVAHLEAFRAGSFAEGSDDARLGEALEVLATTGDVAHRRWPGSGGRHVAPDVQAVLGGAVAEVTWKRLFLDEHEAFAAAVLLVCEQGWNYTTVVELRTPTDLGGDPGRPLYSVQLEKRRRHPPHRYETRSLPDDGPRSPGRLLTRILAATEPARALRRAHGKPSDRLLVFRLAVVMASTSPKPADYVRDDLRTAVHSQAKWRAATGDRVNFRRIRKAVNVRHRREPNQNSRDTHDAAYVLTDPHTAAEAEAVIARGVGNAIEHARRVVAAVAGRDEAATADTATAGCTDHTRSPFSTWGVPCTASFLLCLACTNAVVMPRHLGRLAHLHESLARLRDSLPPAVWAQDWAPHYARLHDLRTNHYTDAQWRQALSSLTEADRDLVGALLDGQLDP
ncbi:hypothetical protein [uncultured Friedmanniella sp.]|uniref:hypothetical protein n=1 Tax=uncultured Friedmanniella sp. TaxID=335381 RepID=UPI0035CAF4F4